MHLLLAVTCLAFCGQFVYSGRLKIQGDHFVMDGKKVFLSGGNQAWVAYGYDFGDNNYQYRKAQYEKFLKMVYEAGGNSIRVWIHIEGDVSPHFDGNGYVTGLDKAGTFIAEFKDYLHKAKEYNILIFPCLWNGATKHEHHDRLQGLIKEPAKLQTYLDKALIPWVNAVKDEPALGGWDIINEFEGDVIIGQANSDPCFDSRYLQHSGAGWAGHLYTVQEFSRFINWQADAIRRADPTALVTAGSYNARTNTDKMGTHNAYSDKCLRAGGGKQHGTLNFFSTHTYAWGGKYDQYAPFKHKAADYGLGRPFVIAEFNQYKGEGMDITEQFAWAYNNGYSGAWTWHLLSDPKTDTTETQLRGIKSLKGKNDQSKGGMISLKL